MTTTLRLLGRARLLAILLSTTIEENKPRTPLPEIPLDPLEDLVPTQDRKNSLLYPCGLKAAFDFGDFLNVDAWHIYGLEMFPDCSSVALARTLDDLISFRPVTSPGKIDDGGRCELLVERPGPVGAVLLAYGNSDRELDRIPILAIDLSALGLAMGVGEMLTFDLLSETLLSLPLCK